MTPEEKQSWDEAEDQFNSMFLHILGVIVALILWMIFG